MGKKVAISKEQRIGVTESGEIAFNLEAFDRLYNGNIIITKRLTDKLIEKLVEHQDKIILHLTVTGMGGSRIEPFVPRAIDTYKGLMKLLEAGFPVSHVVLRVDPIVPTERGMNTALDVIAAFGGIGIKRLRFSFLDNYKHVKTRFKNEGIGELYNGEFHAPLEIRQVFAKKIEEAGHDAGFESIEACGEPGIDSISCLSQKDIDILGLTDQITLEGSAGQRTSCHCPANKSELLKVKPHQCENKCLYCYWR
jgi:DNA repair photolyase